MERQILKILFLLPNDGLGGGVRAIVCFANELLIMGHHVRIFYRDDTGIVKKFYTRIRYGQSKNWLDDFNGGFYAYDRLDAGVFAQDELILSMCARTTFDACTLPDDVGIKVLHCHGMELENRDYMLKSWQLPVPKIVVSSYLIDKIKHETGQHVIGVAPDGVCTDEYFSTVPYSKRKSIGGAIRWRPSKDPETTIKIFHQLHKSIPDANLVTYGPDKNANVDHVVFARNPSIPQAREIYSSCKIWFLASKDEGFGLPVLEAMACGCVVISTDCGGPSDVIVNGVNGYIVDVGNVEMMVNKIKTIWEDTALQRKISKNAIETAKQFTWRAGAEKLEGYLQDIYTNAIEKNC